MLDVRPNHRLKLKRLRLLLLFNMLPSLINVYSLTFKLQRFSSHSRCRSSWYADHIHFHRRSCKSISEKVPLAVKPPCPSHYWISPARISGPPCSHVQFFYAWLYLTSSLSNKVVSTYMLVNLFFKSPYGFLWAFLCSNVVDAGSLALLKPLDLSRVCVSFYDLQRRSISA